ncbi:MAG: ATP-binding protein [Acidobacteriia bacterium]|jgi:predicted ATPase|nr:ATP-binding protein [Terriglobia bacterium]
MSDPRSVLQAKFVETNRFDNFGTVLTQMRVYGFRCHADTTVEVKSPITAFCGINGTGKSTLLQLAAVAYRNNPKFALSYYIKDFLVVGTLDPSPFKMDARVEYKFWQKDHSLKQLTISRNAAKSNWSGYRRRLERPTQFAGVGLYLPRIEMRDFIVRYASKLKVDSSEGVAEHIKKWTCRIMDQSYDDMQRHTVSYSDRSKAVVSVKRGGNMYSEAHMGCGEGRIQYLVTSLEALPQQSCVLIEEPETSLHPHAQREFGNFLVDVATRRGHQIFLTTHSDPLLAALPSLSTVYIHNSSSGIKVVYGLTSIEAKSLMSKGYDKALNVLVEDDVARAILTELIRRINPTALSTTGIYAAERGAEDLKTTIRTVAEAGLPVAVVLDGDKQPTPKENIFALPGTLPPEKELFASAAVRAFVQVQYGTDLGDFSAGLHGVDHHQWCTRLAHHLAVAEEALVWELARVYAKSVPETLAAALVGQLQEASRKK